MSNVFTVIGTVFVQCYTYVEAFCIFGALIGVLLKFRYLVLLVIPTAYMFLIESLWKSFPVSHPVLSYVIAYALVALVLLCWGVKIVHYIDLIRYKQRVQEIEEEILLRKMVDNGLIRRYDPSKSDHFFDDSV